MTTFLISEHDGFSNWVEVSPIDRYTGKSCVTFFTKTSRGIGEHGEEIFLRENKHQMFLSLAELRNLRAAVSRSLTRDRR